jgi:hypothetical protein
MANYHRPAYVIGSFLFGLGAVTVFSPGLRAQTPSTQPQEVPLTTKDCDPSDIGFGSCQWLYPLDAPKKKLLAVPQFRSAKPIYYAAVYGDAPDKTYTLVIDESAGTGKGYDTLYVDLNNDNRIDGPDETVRFPISTTSLERPVRLKFQVKIGEATIPYWVSFTAFPYKGEKYPVENIHANLRNGSYTSGEAVVAGKKHPIALADLDSNGLYNDPETAGIFKGDRFFVDLNDDGKFDEKDSDGRYSGFPLGRYTKIAGQWYTITPRADGQSVRISAASPALGQVAAPALVTRAMLTSPQQEADLDLSSGKAEAVAGEYRLASVLLETKDKAGKTWRSTARWSNNGPQVTVPNLGTVSLPIQAPSFNAAPTAAPSGEDLMIGVQFTGLSGAEFDWPSGNEGRVKPAFQVRDANGKTVASGTFDYG